MNLISKARILEHLKRAEGAESVTLPIEFFRDLLYQATPREWVGLTDEETGEFLEMYMGINPNLRLLMKDIEFMLREKNT
jgi:hypothetical protein